MYIHIYYFNTSNEKYTINYYYLLEKIIKELYRKRYYLYYLMSEPVKNIRKRRSKSRVQNPGLFARVTKASEPKLKVVSEFSEKVGVISVIHGKLE